MILETKAQIPEAEKQNFILLIGLPGCGKSTFAKNCIKEHPEWIYTSSDEIRFNENINENAEVFALMLQRTKDALNKHKTVIYDATNLNRKKRRNLISDIKKLTDKITYYVFIEPYETCLKRNSQRTGRALVPDEIMKRMLSNFQMPMTYEGYDEIHYIKTEKGHPVEELLEITKGFNQESRHHHLKLYEHMMKTYEATCERSDDRQLNLAAMYHDIGKPMTKTFTDTKGNPSKDAHYYGHENAGTYLFLSNETDMPFDDQIKTAEYINWHMRPFQWETDRIKQKDTDLLGNTFIQKIMILNKADINAT